MLQIEANLLYPFLLILSSGKRTFEEMGRVIGVSGDTIARALPDTEESLHAIQAIAKDALKDANSIKMVVDDSLLKKMFAKAMEGTWKLYNGILHTCINGYRWLVVVLVHGKKTFPWFCRFSLPKQLSCAGTPSKLDVIKAVYDDIQSQFSNAQLTLVADGAFVSVEIVKWANDSTVQIEMRMAKNRMVYFNGNRVKLSEIKGLIPKNTQTGRTITVVWNGIPVFVTAHKRLNKWGEASIVYYISTYKATPATHIRAYKKRWYIEKLFRTTKQHLGLEDCQSRSFEKQNRHASAVLLSYSIAQYIMLKQEYKTPEAVFRAIKKHFHKNSVSRIISLDEIFKYV